ncbi:MAG: hypothetical protein KY442_09655 [Proteobacteria bacterium]|nr:hypothetical protein [Pseudomonadota bacterium]
MSNHAEVCAIVFSPSQCSDMPQPDRFQVELTHRDGGPPDTPISGVGQSYHSPEAALAAVLPHARSYAERACNAMWLRIRDAQSQPVFGTLLP